LTEKPLILITNDDGIESPGLAAAAEAMSPLGDLLIVAPRTQQTGAGRSMPHHHEGRLYKTLVKSGENTWEGYGAEASPAQSVQHAIFELADRPIKMAVSGINFGENVGVSVTISGTVGAALEAAAHGIPAMAVSLQVIDPRLHIDFDNSVDFSAAIYFTRLFAERWLKGHRLPDVDVLKIDVPASASPDTEWRVTRLDRIPYYIPVPPKREKLEDLGRVGYRMDMEREPGDGSTDTDALLAGLVSVTPISLDMTSRLNLAKLHRIFEKADPSGRKRGKLNGG
jgi:5'-nucleotidase